MDPIFVVIGIIIGIAILGRILAKKAGIPSKEDVEFFEKSTESCESTIIDIRYKGLLGNIWNTDD